MKTENRTKGLPNEPATQKEPTLVRRVQLNLEIYSDCSYKINIDRSQYKDNKLDIWWDDFNTLFPTDLAQGFSSDTNCSEQSVLLSPTHQLSVKNTQILSVIQYTHQNMKDLLALGQVVTLAQLGENRKTILRQQLMLGINQCAAEFSVARQTISDKVTRKLGLSMPEFEQLVYDFLESGAENYRESALFTRLLTYCSNKDRYLLENAFAEAFTSTQETDDCIDFSDAQSTDNK